MFCQRGRRIKHQIASEIFPWSEESGWPHHSVWLWYMNVTPRTYWLLLVSVIAVLSIGFAAILYSISQHLPPLVGNWPQPQQKANELAKDILKPGFGQKLQPWASQTMDRFRSGQVLIYTNFIAKDWPTDHVMLASQETPDFIRTQWGYTNRLGDMFPNVWIILTDRQPSYLALDWWDWGVVISPPQSRISFGCGGSNEVSPGIYTYFGSFYTE